MFSSELQNTIVKRGRLISLKACSFLKRNGGGVDGGYRGHGEETGRRGERENCSWDAKEIK